MIESLLSIVKPIDAPGSIPFLILAVAVGLVISFIWPRNRRWGFRWLGLVAVTYIVLSLPVVAKGIASTLPSTGADGASNPLPITRLVVFDGDNRRGRVRAAANLFASDRTRHVWVLGTEADWFQDELPPAGIPLSSISIDRSTGTTREQVEWVRRRQGAEPGEQFVIVASRLQAPRITGMLAVADVDVPVIGAPVDREPPVSGLRLFVPTYLALRVSRDALYERAALAYYRSNGWIP